MYLSKFDCWLLKRIAKKLVIQGFDHKRNIIKYYKILDDTARKEFSEDNRPTLDAFLIECHKEALKNV